MRICKTCKIEKSLSEYRSYKNYPTKLRQVCKECENKKARERVQKLREELNKEEAEVIRAFNTLKSADQILTLLVEGYDISWSGKNTIIFNKEEKIVHGKNATKEMYNIVFARYCIELEKRSIKKLDSNNE